MVSKKRRLCAEDSSPKKRRSGHPRDKVAKASSSSKELLAPSLTSSLFHPIHSFYNSNNAGSNSTSNGTSTNSNNASAGTPLHQRLNKLFDTYRDSPQTEPDKILINGAQAYLCDLAIAVDEVVHFALCDLLKVESVGEFERHAFVTGWVNASTSNLAAAAAQQSQTQVEPLDTIARQSAYISQLRKRLTTDPAYFKTIYRAAFKYAKPEHQRSVPLESALEFWAMFFSATSGGMEWNNASTTKKGNTTSSSGSRLNWLDLWLEFYETQGKRPVNKDLWNMVGELALKTKEGGQDKGEAGSDDKILEDWRADGAWPFAIDDFIAWVKEKTARDANSATAASGDKMDTS